MTTDLYHNRVAIRRKDVLQEFSGRFWEPRILPIPLHLDTDINSGKRTAFMGLDSAIFRLIQQRDFPKYFHTVQMMRDSGMREARTTLQFSTLTVME